jgi:hypothetical protein
MILIALPINAVQAILVLITALSQPELALLLVVPVQPVPTELYIGQMVLSIKFTAEMVQLPVLSVRQAVCLVGRLAIPPKCKLPTQRLILLLAQPMLLLIVLELILV